MKKKFLAMILLAGLLLAGCGRRQVSFAGPHFTALREGLEIRLDAPAAPVLEALGAPFGYAETRSNLGTGVEKTYHFPDMNLVTYPGNDGDRILSVQITGADTQTTDGFTVGSTAEQLRACYGENAVRDNRCILSKGKEAVVMQLKNNVVTSIQYSLM